MKFIIYIGLNSYSLILSLLQKTLKLAEFDNDLLIQIDVKRLILSYYKLNGQSTPIYAHESLQCFELTAFSEANVHDRLDNSTGIFKFVLRCRTAPHLRS